MIAKNDQGEIEHESWFTGILNPDQSIEPTISTWTIPSYGDYVVSLELWNNPIDRDLLVDSFIIPISIQKQIESNNDVTPPEISIPPNITRVVNNPDGSVVQFYASVYDDLLLEPNKNAFEISEILHFTNLKNKKYLVRFIG